MYKLKNQSTLQLYCEDCGNELFKLCYSTLYEKYYYICECGKIGEIKFHE